MSLNKALVGSLDRVRVGWILDREIEVQSDITQITLDGLDINRDKAYKIVIILKNPTGNPSSYDLYVNNDTNPVNYRSQYLNVDHLTIASGRASNATIFYLLAGERGIVEVTVLLDPDGYFRTIVEGNRYTGASLQILLQYTTKIATVTNITRLDLIAGTANAIGGGSKMYLFKRG